MKGKSQGISPRSYDFSLPLRHVTAHKYVIHEVEAVYRQQDLVEIHDLKQPLYKLGRQRLGIASWESMAGKTSKIGGISTRRAR